MDAALLQRIDFLQLALNLGGKKQVIHDMLQLFLTSAEKTLADMERAEAEKKIISWQQETHKLKGAAKNITAKRLASLCVEAEEIEEFPHPQSQNVLYNLYKELALLREAIAKYQG